MNPDRRYERDSELRMMRGRRHCGGYEGAPHSSRDTFSLKVSNSADWKLLSDAPKINNRQMLASGPELDLQFQVHAGRPANEGLRLRTRRVSQPRRTRLERGDLQSERTPKYPSSGVDPLSPSFGAVVNKDRSDGSEPVLREGTERIVPVAHRELRKQVRKDTFQT